VPLTKSLSAVGPVAQDFNTAFGLGDSDRSISTVDESGVAFAAIQKLNKSWKPERKKPKQKTRN
jgi:hypothetical protein